MTRDVVVLVGCAALYGFTIGSSHSWTYALRNLIKFPALLLATALVCALAYWTLARFVTSALGFRDVQRLALRLFRDTALLLASLGSVSFFLAMSVEQPRGESLGEYPLFLGVNVVLIALCGTLALLTQARALLARHGLARRASLTLVLGWLALSLFVGGQGAWYLRPFFGVSSLPSDDTPFFLGTRPDFRGATSFYEAVLHLVAPPR